MANEIYGFDYGGPNAAILHANRLVLAGSEVVPDVVVVSNVNEHTDFRTGDRDTQDNLVTTDSHGFWFRQVTARQNKLHAMLQQEGLFFFGDLGEANIPPGPFSATQVVMRQNSWYGSDIGRTVLIVGGMVIFIQAGGQDARGVDWNEQQRKYVAMSLLSKAGPVFTNARDMTFTPSGEREGDTVYVIDRDGDVAVATVSADQPWPAWSTWSTGDESHRVIAATAPRGRLTFLVDRDGVVALEVLDAARNEDVVLDSAGEVAQMEPFSRILETLPFVARSATGSKRSVRKSRIFDLAVDYIGDAPEQTTVSVTGRRSQKIKIDAGVADTGNLRRVRYGGRRGWTDRARVELTWDQHVEVAGIAYKAAG